jgi:hypothetical protein
LALFNATIVILVLNVLDRNLCAGNGPLLYALKQRKTRSSNHLSRTLWKDEGCIEYQVMLARVKHQQLASACKREQKSLNWWSEIQI